MGIERRSGEVKKLEMRISNCELKFFFLVAIADIHLCNYSSSAFQAVIVGVSLSAGLIPAVMKVIAFQAKVSS